jgi:hypothetical protein
MLQKYNLYSIKINRGNRTKIYHGISGAPTDISGLKSLISITAQKRSLWRERHTCRCRERPDGAFVNKMNVDANSPFSPQNALRKGNVKLRLIFFCV